MTATTISRCRISTPRLPLQQICPSAACPPSTTKIELCMILDRRHQTLVFPSGELAMELLGSSLVAGELTKQVGLRLLLSPLTSNVVIKTACCTVGIALPVYSTFKAIEKNDRNEQDRWLLYWAAFGSFSLVEVFSDKILYWFPLYYHVKFAFLVWLQFPSGNGSKHLYSRHLRPFLLRHQARIDRLLGRSSREIAKFVNNHQEEIEYLMSLAKRCALTASQMVKDIVHPPESGRQRRRNASLGPRSIMGRASSSDSDSDLDDDD